MRAYSLAAWSGCLLIGAWAVRPLSEQVDAVGWLASFEAVHIVAHLFLYGTLAILARWAGLTPIRAAALTLTVGALQESVQVIQIGRAPGRAEWFDLFVDAVAIGLGLAVVALRTRSRTRRAASTPAAVPKSGPGV